MNGPIRSQADVKAAAGGCSPVLAGPAALRGLFPGGHEDKGSGGGPLPPVRHGSDPGADSNRTRPSLVTIRKSQEEPGSPFNRPMLFRRGSGPVGGVDDLHRVKGRKLVPAVTAVLREAGIDVQHRPLAEDVDARALSTASLLAQARFARAGS